MQKKFFQKVALITALILSGQPLLEVLATTIDTEQRLTQVVTATNTYEKTPYYQAGPLGMLQGWDLLGFTSLQTTAQVEGEVATPLLNVGAPIKGMLTYAQQVQAVDTLTVTNNTAEASFVIGSNSVVDTTETKENWTMTTVDNQVVTILQPERLTNPTALWQEQDIAFFDFGAAKAELQALTKTWGQSPDVAVQVTKSDQTTTVVVDEQQLFAVYTIPSENMTATSQLEIKGLSPQTETTLVLNVDAKGQTEIVLPEISTSYADGSRASIDANSEQQTNIIVNVYDSQASDQAYTGKVSLAKPMVSNLIAPDADIELNQSLKGFVFADNVTVQAPTYASNFSGTALQSEETPTPEPEQEQVLEPEAEVTPELEQDKPQVETFAINGLTVEKSINKSSLFVGEEATVTLKVSGTQETTPAPITTDEDIMIALDMSASMKSYWNATDNSYRQSVIDFIKGVVDTQTNNGKVRVQLVIFNGPGNTAKDQNSRPVDAKLLFANGTTTAEIETKINAVIAGQHVNDATYTNSTNDAGTNFQDLFGEGVTSGPVKTFINTAPTRNENKRIIIISDWIPTAQKQTNGPTTDTAIITSAQSAGESAYQNQVIGYLQNATYKEKVSIYPIQFGSASGPNLFLDNLQNRYITTPSGNVAPMKAEELVNPISSTAFKTALNNVRAKIAGTSATVTPKLTITDYLDTTKFDYVANSVVITGATGTANHSLVNNVQTLEYKDITKGTSDITISYKVKAKQVGTNIALSPTTKTPLVTDGMNNQTFASLSVNVTSGNSIIQNNLGLNKLAAPTEIYQGSTTEVTLGIKGNFYENTDTNFFSYTGFSGTSYPSSFVQETENPTSKDNNFHYATAKESKMSFQFTGTGFDWYVGNKHQDSITTFLMGDVQIVVKDINNQVVVNERITWGESNSNEDISQRIYSKYDLAYGTYTTTITLNSAGHVYSDRIEIVNPYGGASATDSVIDSQWQPGETITFTGTGFEWHGSTSGEAKATLVIKQGQTTIRTVNLTKNDATTGLLFSESRLNQGTYTATYTVTSGTFVVGKAVSKRADTTSLITITDFIDMTKFEFVPGTYKVMKGTTEIKTTTVVSSDSEIKVADVLSGKESLTLTYKIKAKANATIGETITNPTTKGTITTGTSSTEFANATVTILEVAEPSVPDTGNLTTLKTVTGDGPYTLMLEAKAKPTVIEAKKADIVIMIDKSGSMSDKIAAVKTAAINFANNFSTELASGQVRISVAAFDYSSTSPGTLGASSSVRTTGINNTKGFTTNLTNITNAINGLTAGGGTNTEDAIWRVQDILTAKRADAERFVVFFTDGLPTQSHSGGAGTTSEDRYFADAQEQYYRHFKGYNNPTNVQIGGLGTNQSFSTNCSLTTINGQSATSTTSCRLDLTQTPYSTPTHPEAKFYSVGLFTNATTTTRNQAINFLKTIQNVIEPSQFASKYYTQNTSDITSIFQDISNDIRAKIENTLARELQIHDIVTKEFGIKANSWRVTDLANNPITIAPENIIVSKTANGEDEITFKVGDIIVNQPNPTTESEFGFRVYFEIEPKDPYYSGTGIPTNVNADLSYKDPDDLTTKDQTFKEIPTVTIAPKKGQINITKTVRNESGDVVTDVTPFEIIIERVPGSTDPTGMQAFHNAPKPFILTSGSLGTTGIKQLIGPNTVSATDNSTILSTTTPAEGYLIAGQYIVKEVNLPEYYDIAEIKINGSKQTLTQRLMSLFNTSSKYQSTFTINKDVNSIEIEVINKSTITNKLIKDKTATPVLDTNGKPTGEYEIALNVKTPERQTEQYLGNDWKSNVSSYEPKENLAYDGQQLTLKNGASSTKTYTKGLGVHADSTITYDLTKAPYVGYEQFTADIGIQVNTNTSADVIFEVWVDGVQRYTSGLMTTTTSLKSPSIAISGATELKLVVRKNVNDWYDHANWADAKLTRSQTAAITDATITDLVTDDFFVVQDGYTLNNVPTTAVIQQPQGAEAVAIATTQKTTTENGVDYATLSWSPLTINTQGLTIKFKIKPKDAYHIGENVQTNVYAKVEYDGNTEFFNKPDVDLGIRAQISINKTVVNGNNPLDKFRIRLTNTGTQEQYELELVNGETRIIDRYLVQNSSTPVNKPVLTMTIGTYKIEEIFMPADYDNTKIIVNGIEYTTMGDKLIQDAEFVIDKTNPHIAIQVNNRITPNLTKTATQIANGIYEINLRVDTNGIIPKAGTTFEVNDTVTDQFVIMTEKFYDRTQMSSVNDVATAPTTLDQSNNQLSWAFTPEQIEGLVDDLLSIKFRIKVANEYYGGNDVETNKEAHLRYQTLDGVDVDLLFPVPDVDIPFVIGSIRIEKDIVTSSGTEWTRIPDSEVNPNDYFAVTLACQSTSDKQACADTYTMNLTGKKGVLPGPDGLYGTADDEARLGVLPGADGLYGTADDITNGLMSFYLKDSQTDITPNTDFKQPYIVAGTYKVSELIPMNYQQVDILINTDKTGVAPTWVPLDSTQTVTIDKNNPNLHIKVRNTQVNDGYWYDNARVENHFGQFTQR